MSERSLKQVELMNELEADLKDKTLTTEYLHKECKRMESVIEDIEFEVTSVWYKFWWIQSATVTLLAVDELISRIYFVFTKRRYCRSKLQFQTHKLYVFRSMKRLHNYILRDFNSRFVSTQEELSTLDDSRVTIVIYVQR